MDGLLQEQIIILMRFLISGLLIGLLFDFFRIQRKAIKVHDIVTYVQDILFWVITAIIIIYTVITYTDGEIRSYMVVGLALGVIIYFYIFSRRIMKFVLIIINCIKKILSIFLFPAKKFFKIIKKH